MNVPKLRFKDDDGREFPEWEEKKLGELGKFIGGGTPNTQNEDFWNGNIPWISTQESRFTHVNARKYPHHISDSVELELSKLSPIG
ncbi:restriction endonuclease subunit S [Nitrosomonas nitrosa]|uniref:restriction endonuclease subunit S n=1 Tax=Nitrosomonas nitrosa TaxID=52442 RepID=UPI0023F6C39A|nr:restriction endonuclease subunit S [Nitrosomonas nitrosa]MCO6435333.1 restriction endonuclease subunit S [Nitrosomonas nitrosa]